MGEPVPSGPKVTSGIWGPGVTGSDPGSDTRKGEHSGIRGPAPDTGDGVAKPENSDEADVVRGALVLPETVLVTFTVPVPSPGLSRHCLLAAEAAIASLRF